MDGFIEHIGQSFRRLAIILDYLGLIQDMTVMPRWSIRSRLVASEKKRLA